MIAETVGRLRSVTRVSTSSTGGGSGSVECEYVVNATGMWARELALRSGLNVPNTAAEHYYLITDTIDGLGPDTPVADVEAQCDALATQHHVIDDIGVAVWRYGFYGTRVLWLLGYADQAQQWMQEALARAQHFAAILSQHCRDLAATQASAEAVLALATAQGFEHRVA